MSTEQPTLGETFERLSERGRERMLAALDGEGAAYTGRDGAHAREGDSGPAERCQCGADVSSEVARVLGDNQGVVAGCEECWRTPNGDAYQSDAVAARMAVHGEGHRDEEVDVDES